MLQTSHIAWGHPCTNNLPVDYFKFQFSWLLILPDNPMAKRLESGLQHIPHQEVLENNGAVSLIFCGKMTLKLKLNPQSDVKEYLPAMDSFLRSSLKLYFSPGKVKTKRRYLVKDETKPGVQ